MVEVLAAIVILSIAIIPMFTMFDTGLRTAVLGSNYDEARALANEKLEEVKALSYTEARDRYKPPNSPNPCVPPSPNSAFDCEVETRYLDSNLENPTTGPATSYMSVEVTVSWDGGDNEITTTGLKVR
jgi:Tfp pilus assembly protein PilV